MCIHPELMTDVCRKDNIACVPQSSVLAADFCSSDCLVLLCQLLSAISVVLLSATAGRGDVDVSDGLLKE